MGKAHLEEDVPMLNKTDLGLAHEMESKAELDSEEDEPKFNCFEPGAIHKEKFRSFWVNTLKADEWVVQTLEKGYMIPFKEPPTKVFVSK